MHSLASVDGAVVPLGAAHVPLTDRGLLLADGLFETMRAVGGRIVRFEEHARRFAAGLEALRLPDLRARFRSAAEGLVAAADVAGLGDDLYLRVTATAGDRDGVTGPGEGRVFGVCRPSEAPPAALLERGVRAVLAAQRKDPADPLCGVKHLAFAPQVAARRAAVAAGADDAVLCNVYGDVADATSSNVFAVVDGAIHAPGHESGALPGVTRLRVLEAIAEEGLPTEEPLSMAQLGRAEEAWLTNTTLGVLPLTEWQGRPVGNGRPGGLTLRLRTELERRARDGHA